MRRRKREASGATHSESFIRSEAGYRKADEDSTEFRNLVSTAGSEACGGGVLTQHTQYLLGNQAKFRN